MMTVFDEEGKLRHFTGAEELLNYYNGVMLKSREVLRVKMVEEARERVKELALKIRFIEEIIEDPMLLAGRKEDELQEWMKSREYPKTFLDMRLGSITEKMHKHVHDQLEKEETNLEYYERIDAADLWLYQLEQFSICYDMLYPDT